jgi:ferredoxin
MADPMPPDAPVMRITLSVRFVFMPDRSPSSYASGVSEYRGIRADVSRDGSLSEMVRAREKICDNCGYCVAICPNGTLSHTKVLS